MELKARETVIHPSTARRSSVAASRGSESAAGAGKRERMRVLALNIAIDWKSEESKALYKRIRDLSWQAAFYRNNNSLARLAEKRGWRMDPAAGDEHDISKKARKVYKGELSGDAYSAAEQEVAAAFSRDIKKILAGQPPPFWRPAAALSVTGRADRSHSGIRLEKEGESYVALVCAQSVKCADGSWLRLPIAKNTKRDEHQAPVLDAMVTWEIPICKATIQVKPHALILRLVYRTTAPVPPPPGQRIATLGPVTREGRLLLRTDTEGTQDYSSKLALIQQRKTDWDLIRRRAMAQIGRRKGHARLKREVLARLSWDEWLQTYLHQWSSETVRWCASQGVGTIRVEGLSSGDWPADKLTGLLRYKAEDFGMELKEGADVLEPGGMRTAKAAVAKQQRNTRKRHEAERELRHQLGERS